MRFPCGQEELDEQGATSVDACHTMIETMGCDFLPRKIYLSQNPIHTPGRRSRYNTFISPSEKSEHLMKSARGGDTTVEQCLFAFAQTA